MTQNKGRALPVQDAARASAEAATTADQLQGAIAKLADLLDHYPANEKAAALRVRCESLQGKLHRIWHKRDERAKERSAALEEPSEAENLTIAAARAVRDEGIALVTTLQREYQSATKSN